MSKNLIDFFNANKKTSQEFSILMMQYLSFNKRFKTKDLKLFMHEKDYIELSKEEKLALLKQFSELKKESYLERKAYHDFIMTHIQKNLLNIKINQIGLNKKELEKLKVLKDEQEKNISNFNTNIFNLNIEKLIDFYETLSRTETAYNSLYRESDFYFKDIDLIDKINKSDLTQESTLNFLSYNFFKTNISSFEEEIAEALFEKMIKIIDKGFLNPQNRESETLFDILGKVLSKELKAFSNFARGLSLA